MLAYASSKTATIRLFETNEDIGEFDKSDSFAGVALTADESCVLLANCFGEIMIYDIRCSLGPGRVLKQKKSLSLPPTEKITVFDLSMNDKERQSVRQTLITSPDSSYECGYVIACYKGVSRWEAFLCHWTLHISGRFMRKICENRELTEIHPRFSYDGRLIVVVYPDNIQVLFSHSGLQARTFNLQQMIRSFHVSASSPEIGVLTGKDFLLLSLQVEEGECDAPEDRKRLESSPDTNGVELIPAEHLSHNVIQPRVMLSTDAAGDIKATESVVLAAGEADLLKLSSARNNRSAVDTWFTPDSQKIVQLHVRCQIVDADREEIVYSPRTGDVVQRPIRTQPWDQAATALAVFQTLQMPESSGSGVLELGDGDRVVGEGNKVRLRVGKTTARLQVVNVPSVFLVSCRDENTQQLRRLHRIRVYQVRLYHVHRNCTPPLALSTMGTETSHHL